MLNIAAMLDSSVRNYPDKEAFIFMDNTLTYAQLNATSNQVANGLKSMGIGPGDNVALSCLNLPYFPIIYFGILKTGATVVPLSVLLKQDEIAYHLQDSEAKAYFCFVGTPELPMLKMGHAGFSEAPSCEHLIAITAKPTDPSPIEGITTLGAFMAKQSPVTDMAQTPAESTAAIVYTSGTTGRPKGAELTHSGLMMNTVLSAGFMGTDSEDTQLIVLPMFHVFAMTVLMLTGVYKGTRNVLLPRFDPTTVLGLLQKHQVTIFAGVPTMYWALLNADTSGFDIESIAKNLKICGSGGASLPVEVLTGFEKKFNTEILEGYGMSEGSPVVTFNQRHVGRKVGSIGTPVWGVEVKVVDENQHEVPVGEKGQIVYRGHNVMKGYYNKPEATKATIIDGWLQSGDVGIMDEDGFFYIVDRTKDMIIRGGLNVYPREVEELMMTHEAISLVAVIGVPHEKMGEEIKACVVCKEGTSIEEEELKKWVKSKIADYKYPRVIEFMDALPMSATGKILKKELRKMDA